MGRDLHHHGIAAGRRGRGPAGPAAPRPRGSCCRGSRSPRRRRIPGSRSIRNGPRPPRGRARTSREVVDLPLVPGDPDAPPEGPGRMAVEPGRQGRQGLTAVVDLDAVPRELRLLLFHDHRRRPSGEGIADEGVAVEFLSAADGHEERARAGLTGGRRRSSRSPRLGSRAHGAAGWRRSGGGASSLRRVLGREGREPGPPQLAHQHRLAHRRPGQPHGEKVRRIAETAQDGTLGSPGPRRRLLVDHDRPRALEAQGEVAGGGPGSEPVTRPGPAGRVSPRRALGAPRPRASPNAPTTGLVRAIEHQDPFHRSAEGGGRHHPSPPADPWILHGDQAEVAGGCPVAGRKPMKEAMYSPRA